MKLSFFVVLLVLFTSGCARNVRIVKAEVPLVEEVVAPVGEKVPAIHIDSLESDSATQLYHSDYKIKLGMAYLSALGRECRVLSISQNDETKVQRVACAYSKLYEKQTRAWYLVPNIVQSTSSIQL